MTRFIVFTALFFATLVALTILFMPDSSTARPIQEDEPGWNCRTMGNKLCGPKEAFTARFDHYDQAFNCFAEVAYSEPQLSWNARVSRCIPDSPAP